MPNDFSVALTEFINNRLLAHLIRPDGQEDLCFGFWIPSQGDRRLTALVNAIELPNVGDRDVHGNVSFNSEYFKRTCSIAMKKKHGICFLHSHPGPGWQGMSSDDIKAESKMAPTVFSLTDLPLVGLTVGSDGTWSARIWNHEGNGKFRKVWASGVRTVGLKLRVDFNDAIVPKPRYRDHFKRTITVYGKHNHEQVSRLRVGIVGLGSVGSILAETLARMGFQKFVLIDFDVIKKHNLDRQIGATEKDLGKPKVSVAKRQILTSGTANPIEVITVKDSVAKPRGYSSALDCDILFSCVDRPWPRYILNHLAYAHLIPVIDGGIRVKFDESESFESAEWQLQTITPDRPCLRCLGAYEPSEVDLERAGKLDDPSYLSGLPKYHHLKSNENIVPFSINLASMEIFQLISLATGIGGTDFAVQRFRYIHGFVSNYNDRVCSEGCPFVDLVSTGDSLIKPI